MDPLLTALSAVDFQWTARVGSIWQDSASDIPELQNSARDQVRIRLTALGRVQPSDSPLDIPSIGQGGSGKTHLLGAIRRDALQQGHFFVLADMTDIREFLGDDSVRLQEGEWRHPGDAPAGGTHRAGR